MDTLAGREGPQGALFVRFDRCQEIIVHKVCIPHGRGQIGVTHGLLDQRRALPRGQPGGHAAVSEVVLPRSTSTRGRRRTSALCWKWRACLGRRWNGRRPIRNRGARRSYIEFMAWRNEDREARRHVILLTAERVTPDREPGILHRIGRCDDSPALGGALALEAPSESTSSPSPGSGSKNST